MTRPFAVVPLILAIASGCIDEGSFVQVQMIAPVSPPIGFVTRGDDLRLRVDADVFVSANGSGTILIDSATVVATVEGETITYDDPDIESDGFPIEGEPGFDAIPVTFEVPSPIDDADSFEARCPGNNRNVTVTAKFYATQGDRRGAEDPPLTTATLTLPLLPIGDPVVEETFASSDVLQFATNSLVTGQPPNVSAGGNDDVLFALEAKPIEPFSEVPTSHKVYRADSDSVQLLYDSFDQFLQVPRVAAREDGGAVIGGRSHYVDAGIELLSLGPSGIAEATGSIVIDPGSSLEQDALGLGVLARSANGFHAVVQSSYAVVFEETSYPPPEGRYYGAYLVEMQQDLVTLSVTPLEREIVSLERFDDGTTLRATVDLPPRGEAPTLVVEHLDIAGAPMWTHVESVSAYEVVVRPTEDGGAVLSYTTDLPGRIQVVRVDDEGQEVFRYTPLGATPSIAVTEADTVLVAFVGQEPAFDVPGRSVPLLVEVGPDGVPIRGAQLACGGLGAVSNALDGSASVVGFFTSRMTIGGRSLEVAQGDIVVARLQ